MRGAVILLLVGCTTSSSVNPEALRNHGIVTIDSRTWKSGGTTYGQGSVSAGFFREQLDPYVGCSKKTFGACSVRSDCKPIFGQPLTDLGLSPYASAGKVTVGGLDMPVELTVMEQGMFVGQYTTLQSFMPIFSGGEALTVIGAGAEVPPFTGSVTAPARPTITVPQAVNSQLTVPRSQDLVFLWTGGGSGQLHLEMLVQPTMGTPAGLDCSWPAADGMGRIPTAALQLMPAGSAQNSLSVLAQSTLTAGDWTVQLTATTGPVQPSGSPYEFASLLLE